MNATVLWIDNRTKKYEGQVLADNGKKYYFNYSTSIEEPVRGQIVKIEIELDETTKIPFVMITGLL